MTDPIQASGAPDPDEPAPASLPAPAASEPVPASAAASPDVQVSPPRRSRALPVLTALGFVLVLAALAWLWNDEQQLQEQLAQAQQAAAAPRPSPDAERVAALESGLRALEQKLAQQKPAPAPAPPVDLGPLQARLATLESRIASAPDPNAAARSVEQAVDDRLAKLDSRLKDAEQRESALAARAAKLQRLEQAQVALDAGEPLGDIPGAPPALTRFAQAKPPTEASLRLAFPAAADTALAASRPPVEGKPLGERIMVHLRSLVTVKKGNEVLVGAPASTVLGEAQAKLDAGDLAGAVAALDGLDPAAAAKMAGWRQQAQALLDARAALAATAKS